MWAGSPNEMPPNLLYQDTNLKHGERELGTGARRIKFHQYAQKAGLPRQKILSW